MLDRVRFQNIRALADLSLELGRLTVLVGRNACGKSTILDEIERLCAMSRPDPENSNALAGPGAVIHRSGEPARTWRAQGPTIWQGSAGDRTLIFAIEAPDERPWYRRAALAARAGKQEGHLGRKDNGVNSPEEIAQANAFLRQNMSWRAQRLSLERAALLAPSPVNAPLDQIEPGGYGLATLLLHLAANYPESYAAIQDDLRAVVPTFERLYVRKTGDEERNKQSAYALDLVLRGAGRIPAELASEGTLLALGLLTALHAPELPEIILLDDLERGLHLSAQNEIVQAIRRVQESRPEVQVICTSHAPVLVDSFKAEEVRVLALDEQGHTVAKPLTALPEYARWAGALRPGELWANFGEEWVLGHG